MKKLLLCLLLVGSIMALCAQNRQAAMDAPNLDFSMGNFTNWTRYTGKFMCDDRSAADVDKTYHYEWTEMADDDNRITLFGDVNTEDPILQCDGFYINPDPGKKVARIGVPQKTEGYVAPQDYAAAERLEYTYTITEATSILKYRFAAVLHLPEFSGTSTEHYGPERPYFGVSVEVTNPDGTTSIPACAAYSTVVNQHAQQLQQGTSQVNGVACSSSAGDPAQYMFQPWTSALVDLRSYIGSKVTITVITHDCFFRAQGSTYPYTGNHEAYGYFRAEAMDMNLSTRVCNAQAATIAAPEGYHGYDWSRSDHFAIQANDPAVPNVVTIPFEDMVDNVTYQCTLTDELGCAAIDLKTQLDPVTLVPKFDYEAKCGGEVIFEDQSEVSGDNLVNWMWTVGEGETTTNVSNHTYSAPGDYEVKLTATTSNGCQESFAQTVHVPYFPKLSINTQPNVCEGKEVNISVSNVEFGSSVKWTSSLDAHAQVLSEQESFVIQPHQSQTYKVVVTDPRDCVYEQKADVTVFGSTPIHISGQDKACPTDAVELTLVGQNLTDIAWNVAGGANQNTVMVYPNADVTYRVTATDANGCEVEATHSISVYPRPQFTVEAPAVCEGNDAVVTATGAESYQWHGIPGATTGGTQVITQPTNTTSYLVTGYTEHGCFNSQTFSVHVIKRPEISITGQLQRCFDTQPFELTAHGASTYLWNGTEGEDTYTAPSDRSHTLRVVGVVDGCESDPQELSLTTLPVPELVALTPEATICEGDEITLQVSGADSYEWQGVSDNTDKLLVSPVEDKVYTVRGISAQGCYSNEVEIPVTVHHADQVQARIEKIIACPGKPDSAIVVAEGALSYRWSSFPENEQVSNTQSDRLTVLFEEPTVVTVEGTNQFACHSKAQVSLERLPEPTFEFKVEPEWVEAGNTEVRFTGMAPNNAVTWWWNVGDGSALLQSRDTIHTYQIDNVKDPFLIEVTAIDQYGCRFEGQAEVKIWKEVWAPTAFSPNGDGINDLYGFYSTEDIESFTYYIYNRLGEIVFEGNAIDDVWDGTYQGKPCPWGMYGWVAQYKTVINGVDREGTIRGQLSIVK